MAFLRTFENLKSTLSGLKIQLSEMLFTTGKSVGSFLKARTESTNQHIVEPTAT